MADCRLIIERVAGVISPIVLVIITFLLVGCSNIALGRFSPTNVASKIRPDIKKYNLRHIAVMPFRNNTPAPEAGHKVATFFYEEIITRKIYSVTPPVRLEKTEEIELEFRVDPSRRAGTVNREENLRQLGRAVSNYLKQVAPYTTNESLLFQTETPERDPEDNEGPAIGEVRSPNVKPGEDPEVLDAVVTGVITRYTNRHGNPLAADKPSSVSFDIYLISVHDGKILWSARFDEKQEFLNENILLLPRFIKGGGIWQSNDTLTQIGMERVMDTFPGIAERLRELLSKPVATGAP